ncbi:MAG: hypothetical protein IK014_11400 [Lachnospiraceae bacterium]|nr:hypothetical protein [Lachnospiraceae bacterium]
MIMGFYLLNLKLSGIKNIAKEIELDFYNKVLEGFNPEKHRVKAIYGENGSGKTAIITAVSIAKKIVFSPNYLKQTDTQTLLYEIINKATHTFSIEFKFAYKGEKAFNIYRYGLSLTINENNLYEICYEKLEMINNYTKNKKYLPLIDIKDGQILSAAVNNDDYLVVKEKTLNLLRESSFISRCYNDRIIAGELTKGVFYTIVFFADINVYLEEEDTHELYLIGRNLSEAFSWGTFDDNENKPDIDKHISYMDSRGRDIVFKENFLAYKKKIDRLCKFLRLFKSDLKEIKIDKRDDGETYKCELVLDYGKYSVNREFESTGIKKLIKLYDALVNADEGGISFIDEMDANLNDVYLCKIIEYFTKYGKGQLCFTTHNLDPMSVLKSNRNAIDFLSSDNKIIPWKVTGNAAPDRYYRNGMIEDMPFNVDAIDFIGMFGE